MTNERLINDTCFAIAKDMLALLSHLLREDEHRDAFDEFYAVARKQLLLYESQRERMHQRLYGDRRN